MCADEEMLHQSSVGHRALTQGPADVPLGKKSQDRKYVSCNAERHRFSNDCLGLLEVGRMGASHVISARLCHCLGQYHWITIFGTLLPIRSEGPR